MQRPALGKVPGVGQDDLVLKATATGITFLHDRRFRKRYNGSKACAVDIHGNFWQNGRELENAIKGQSKEKPTKRKSKDIKKAGTSPCLKVFVASDPGCVVPESGAISEEIAVSENFARKVAKKERKKSYSINKREVRQRILGYINTMRGSKELYFWTVSFPAGTPDDVCYQAFNIWLTTLRARRKGPDGKLMKAMLREYLWIAERQLGARKNDPKTATGTIHFHIAIPHFMNVQRANAAMRGTLKNLSKKGLLPGCVTDPRSKQQYYLPSIAKYNGVDICKHRTTKRVVNFAIKKGSRALATYLTKYVTKNNAGEVGESGEIEVPGFSHLAWHNSRGFSCLFTGVMFTINEFIAMGFKPFLNKVRQFKMNFATFIPWLYSPPPLLLEHLYQLNSCVQTVLDTETTEPLPVFDSLLFTHDPDKKTLFIDGTYRTVQTA